VLPIGGVKEKVLGACRAGITTVILPKQNMPDLEDLSEEERCRITVHAVESLGDVFDVALNVAPETKRASGSEEESATDVDFAVSRG
jgi:ATP-dependent Lon protease